MGLWLDLWAYEWVLGPYHSFDNFFGFAGNREMAEQVELVTPLNTNFSFRYDTFLIPHDQSIGMPYNQEGVLSRII